MLVRASAFFTVALAGIATAAPSKLPRGDDGAYCNTGNLKCCNTIQSAGDPQISKIAGLLDIPIEALTGNVGIACLPIDAVLGLLNPISCTQQPVCCEHDAANGLVGIGCIPLNLNL